ncbi:Uncharacterised protein [Chlamydia trachomatis]|nr:Uncharacterised protein [Chlamydia trachomatis]
MEQPEQAQAENRAHPRETELLRPEEAEPFALARRNAGHGVEGEAVDHEEERPDDEEVGEEDQSAFRGERLEHRPQHSELRSPEEGAHRDDDGRPCDEDEGEEKGRSDSARAIGLGDDSELGPRRCPAHAEALPDEHDGEREDGGDDEPRRDAVAHLKREEGDRCGNGVRPSALLRAQGIEDDRGDDSEYGGDDETPATASGVGTLGGAEPGEGRKAQEQAEEGDERGDEGEEGDRPADLLPLVDMRIRGDPMLVLRAAA